MIAVDLNRNDSDPGRAMAVPRRLSRSKAGRTSKRLRSLACSLVCSASAVLCVGVFSEPAHAHAHALGPVVIQTWSGQRIDAESLEVDEASLSYRSGGVKRQLGWHSIRRLDGIAEQGDVQIDEEAVSEFLALGQTVWRATTRLNRGDSFGAEPLFEDVFERTRGKTGPTPAVVADGLLRCRLRRGARAAAIDVWLELAANLAVAPAAMPQWGMRSPAVDARTKLVPSLAPIWFEGPAARAFADDPHIGDVDVTDAASAIRVLYRAAARHAVGYPIDASRTAQAAEVASTREGGSLVAQVVIAQLGGPEARRTARASLKLEQRGGVARWRSVWASIAIGRSLLREPDAADRRRGILELLAVHALDAEVSPYLTGIALADAVVASRELGDQSAVRVILGDLRRSFPDHPVRRKPSLDPTSSASPGGSL